ncbi:iron export ABC transporter permease subunit FetB [Phormidium tenue FACHB-886]|nr:iron export ABC transporter permease subunit FetB [Phormidium tenue FACHB-886]
MNELIQLDLARLGLAMGLMVLAVALSAWQRLGLEGSLTIATGRTILQLLVVGYVLEIIFAVNSPWAVLGIVMAMSAIAAVVARNRISRKVPHLLPIVGGAIVFSSAFTLAYTTLLVLQPETWYNPRYLVPLAGILLGNTMNAAAIAGERFVTTLNNSQLEIETHLSLGATPQQATWQYRRDAIKAGLIPTINSMMVVGLVTLPGVFTGQVLGGINPLNAALYQILIMFVLAIATLICTSLVIQGVDRQFFNAAAQLRTY